jgi:hypothetical protein
MKTMRKKIISGLLLLSMLTSLWIPAFADAPATQTWTGWLIDYDCVGANPKTHTQTCNLMPTCIASGEGMYVYSEGKAYNTYNAASWLPFDQASHVLAAQLNRILSDSSDHEAHLAKYSDRIPTIKVTGYLVNNVPYHDSDPSDPNDQAQLPITDLTKSVTGTVTGIHITSIEFTYITYNGVAVSNYEVTDPEKVVITEASTIAVPGAPTAVSAVAGNSQATVSFTAPVSNGGGEITGYKVQTYSGGALQKTTAGTGSPITVTTLLNGTPYAFTVRAVNSAGDGPESTTSVAVTPVFDSSALPAVSADVDATVGSKVTLTFTDNAVWRNAIISVSVSGTAIDSSLYTITEGNITILGNVFASAGNYTILIRAAGYPDATVVQTVLSPAVWTRNYRNYYEAWFTSLTATEDGGYLAAGYTYVANTDGSANKNAILYKYNKDGGIVWQKVFTTGTQEKDEVLYDIKPTADGGYIAAGYRYGSVNGSSSGALVPDYGEALLLKLDPEGNVQWERALKGTYTSTTYAPNAFKKVNPTSDGGYIAAGSFLSGDGDFNGLKYNNDASLTDGIVVKFDSTGNVVWKKSIGGSQTDSVNDVRQTTVGYIAVGSDASQDGDFSGVHYGTANITDGFILKLDENGNTAGPKVFGGSKEDSLNSLLVLSDGSYVVAGYSASSDYDLAGKDPTKYAASDGIAAKFTASDELSWLKLVGGTKNDAFNSIKAAADGNYLLAGYSQSNDNDFNYLHIGKVAKRDAIAVKLSSDGSRIVWKKDFGGTADDEFYDITEAIDGQSIAAAGRTKSNDYDLGGLDIVLTATSTDAVIATILTPPMLSVYGDAIYGENATLTFVDDEAWREAVTGVFLDGTTVSGASYVLTQGSIKINAEVFTSGTSYPIGIRADGYAEATAIQEFILYDVPELSADPDVAAGENVTLTFTDNVDWREAITAILVNGAKVGSGLYTVTSGSITVDSSLFPSAGSYSIIVQAAKYVISSVIQSVTEPGKLSAPVLSSDTDARLGENVTLSFTDDVVWREAVASVAVNGTLIDAGSYSVTPGGIEILSVLFPSYGEYDITVKAEGYSDAKAIQSVPTYIGWIIDYDCLGAPTNHTQTCNLMPACIASGEGLYVYTQGKASNQYGGADWIPFDQVSQETVKQLLQILSGRDSVETRLTKYSDSLPFVKVNGYPVTGGIPSYVEEHTTDYTTAFHITSIEFYYLDGVSSYKVTSPENLALTEVSATSAGAITAGNTAVTARSRLGGTLKYDISGESVTAKNVVSLKRTNEASGVPYEPSGLSTFTSGAGITVSAGQYIHIYEILAGSIVGYGEHQVTAGEIAASKGTDTGSDVKPGNSTTTKTWTGWLIDYDCVGANPKTHTQDCNLMPECIASGFGIQVANDNGTAGSWIPFDSSSQSLAKQLNLQLSDPDDPEKHLDTYPNLIPTIKVTGYTVTTGLPSNITDYTTGIHISSIKFYYIEGVSAYQVTTLASGDSASATTESGIGTENSPDPIKDAATGKVSISLTATLDKTVATAVVTGGLLKSAFELADAGRDGRKSVSIVIPKLEGAESYQLQIPVSFVTAGTGTSEIIIKTDIGTFTIPDNLFDSKELGAAENIVLSIGAADFSGVASGIRAKIGGRPVVNISAQSGGKPLDFRNEDAPVLILIPYTPTEEEKKNTGSLVVLYLDDSNQAIPVPNGKYDPQKGAVTFYTTHFSKYAVAQVTKTFGDIGGVSWAKEAIEALASRGAVDGITKTAFKPNANITRGDFIKQLVSALGLSASFEGNFSDVAKTDTYYQAAGVAKKLGIATGSGNNRFEPKAEITRQDLIVLTARALKINAGIGTKSTAADLKGFVDQKEVSSYATESIAALVKEEIIRGNGAYLCPKSKTTRAEAAVILYRILKKY